MTTDSLVRLHNGSVVPQSKADQVAGLLQDFIDPAQPWVMSWKTGEYVDHPKLRHAALNHALGLLTGEHPVITRPILIDLLCTARLFTRRKSGSQKLDGSDVACSVTRDVIASSVRPCDITGNVRLVAAYA